MSNSEPIEIASFGTTVEADYACSYLRENGIEAIVDGAAANSWMPHVGTALGGVRVLTTVNQADAAKKLLAERETTSSRAAGDWFCSICKETIDADFAVCWSCGKERAAVETQPECSRSETDSQAQDWENTASTDANSELSDQHPKSADLQLVETADQLVQRAYRTAKLAIVWLPIILHIYALNMLLRAANRSDEFTGDSQHLWNRAMLLTLVGLLIWIALLVPLLIRFS